jgi:hypothetical protein
LRIILFVLRTANRYDKKRGGTRYAELVFLHLVGAAGHVVHSGAYGAPNVYALFFMLGCDRYGFDKKCVGTRYAELVFLHPLGSTGLVVHYYVSVAQNANALLFMLRWDRNGFASSRKSMSGHVTRILCFCIGGICASHN